MPWLKASAEVTVLTVNKPDQHTDASRLLDVLSREDVRAKLIEEEPINGRSSARILASAEEIGASLIVMGAFRYGSLVEWALGKTTHRTIAQSKVPLMLAH